MSLLTELFKVTAVTTMVSFIPSNANHDSRNSISETEAILKNLTEERADLKRILNDFGKYDYKID